MIAGLDPPSDEARFELRFSAVPEPRLPTLAAAALSWVVVGLFVLEMPYVCGVSLVWPALGLYIGARLLGTRKPPRGWTLRARASGLEVEYDDGQRERYDWPLVAGKEVLDGIVLDLGAGRVLEIPDTLLPDRAPLLAALPEGFTLVPELHRRLVVVVGTPRWKQIGSGAVVLWVLYALLILKLHR